MQKINNMIRAMDSRIQTTLVFLLYYSSFQLIRSANTSKNMYFINCGSNTNVLLSDGRTFEGDLNSTAFTFTKRGSSTETNPSVSNGTLSLYQTARVFKKTSMYNFDIKDKGIYILRIHFFAFSLSTKNLSAATFSVAAGNPKESSVFLLLSDFSLENYNNSGPLIKEFSLNIEVGAFAIYFIPGASSFAFVNAIEAHLPGKNIFSEDDENVQVITPEREGDYLNNAVKSKVLQTVYRINAGGPEIRTDRDALWRRWIPDDSFLVDPENSETKSRDVQGNDVIFAPDAVFQDVRVLKADLSSVSWSFKVQKNASHFIRAHFYDVVGSSKLQVRSFSFSIYKSFSEPVNCTLAWSAPIYNDYVVESDDYGFLNFSIIPEEDFSSGSVFLNGLEIMEMTDKLIPVPNITRVRRTRLVFLVVGAVLVLVCILVFFIFFVRRRKKLKSSETSICKDPRDFKIRSAHSKTVDTSTPSPVSNINLGLRIPFAEIKLATRNFDQKMMIGEGGFGKVYKGTLRGGKVAVKRSEPGSDQGLSEFETEIMMLSKIRHKHLVSLIGYCDENNEMILVYEYVEKGTLKDHLYGSNLPCLSWKQRLEICVGAARGIHYLHSGFAGGIIHRDVKSTNILLDGNHVAKVADFGLSKSGWLDQSHVVTGVKGTFGYLDPEYLLSEQLTEKSDVYSFGVVLLEVLCARKPIDTSVPREQVNLAEWGVNHINKGMIQEIVDPLLAGQMNPSSLRKFGETATKCLEEDGAHRPSMGDVIWDLEYALQLQQTASHGEPHSDIFTNVSSDISSSKLKQFSSFGSTIVESRMLSLTGDNTEPDISEVFSELKNGNAR